MHADLGSTSFVISPQAAKAFKVPVVKRIIPAKASDSENQYYNRRLFTIPLGLSFGNIDFGQISGVQVMKNLLNIRLIPDVLDNHRAQGITEEDYTFQCDQKCFGHERYSRIYQLLTIRVA